MSSLTESELIAVQALMALSSGQSSSTKLLWSPENKGTVIARLEGREFEYMVRQKRIIIGRNSSVGDVDVDMGESSLISRTHLELFFEHPNFYMMCHGKNGVFVNGVFNRKGPTQLKIPKTCTFCFPHANVSLEFQSLVDEADPTPNVSSKSVRAPLSNLRINVPAPDMTFTSPFPPNTGTVSKDILLDRSSQEKENQMFWSNGCPPPILETYSPTKVGEGLDFSRPPYSYPQLIVQAVASAPDKKIKLRDIYSYINKNYPYFDMADKNWQNCIRHNLSLSPYFFKMPLPIGEHGRGCYWYIAPEVEAKLIRRAFEQRMNICPPSFCVPFGVTSRYNLR